MSSIMQMFQNAFGGGSQSTQQPQQQPSGAGQPGNIPPNAGSTEPNNPQLPAGTNQSLDTQTTQTQTAAAPMAEFADLWQPVATDQANTATSILGNIDPSKVMEVAGKTDFSKVVTQDQMQKIQQGGPEAMQAMVEMMNKMSQTVYGQAAIASSKIVEQAATKMEERFKSQMGAEMKRNAVSENLRGENPIFNNPAVAPLISAMEQQFTLKHPNASSAEITQMAKNYIASVGAAFSPQANQQQQNNSIVKPGETDWSTFLN